MSVHQPDDENTSLWLLAVRGNRDNPSPWGLATPFGILDGGHLFFRGFASGSEEFENFKNRLRQMQARKTASAKLDAQYSRGDDGNVLIAISVENLSDVVLNSENEATLVATVMANERHPYFSVSAKHIVGGGLCTELAPGASARCGLPLGNVSEELLADSEVLVSLTYRPDPARESHDSMQSTIASAPPPPDQPPFVANPVSDVLVERGTLDHSIDLTTVFSDPDDPDESISLRVAQNSNPGLVSTELVGRDLTLTFPAPESSGMAEITIEADSNGLKANTSFSVHVSDGFLVHQIYMPVQKKRIP